MKQNLKYIYGFLPVAGVLFCLVYMTQATSDIIFSDYIRLVNTYLPDVWDPSKFFVPDIITRIPITYLARVINVSVFGYSTTFDMVLGILALGISGGIITFYSYKKKLGPVWALVLMVIVFSLNKWEMLTNGTGWPHFLAFAGFYYHYLIVDRVLIKESPRSGDHAKLIVLPFLITLTVAGAYCAIYSVTLLLAYGWIWIHKRDKFGKQLWIYGICVLASLLLYMWSNALVTEPAVTFTENTGSIIGEFIKDPVYFLKFLLTSFGSTVLGNEVATEYHSLTQNFRFLYGLGFMVFIFYLAALFLNIATGLHKKTIFPLMLIASGGLNHLLILVARWRFGSIEFAMSSRYGLQFQIGIIGIILTFALIWRSHRKSVIIKVVSILCCVTLLGGNLITTWKELKKAPSRKEYSQGLVETAKHFETASEEELIAFQYRNDIVKIKEALSILKENNLNVFRD